MPAARFLRSLGISFEPSQLPAFFHRIAETPGEFIIQDDGYRGWTWSYREIARMAETFRGRMRRAGVGKGDMVVIWSESRAGWIAALWASILHGIVLAPVDPLSDRQCQFRFRGRHL